MEKHDGHRSRLKARFLSQGLDGFTDIQVLELMLYYCIPQKDTNPLAHRLLDRFGSLHQVLDAPMDALTQVSGVGEHTALFLHLITEVCRFYQVDRATKTAIVPTLESCAEYMRPFFFGRKLETVFLLCLDAKCKVLCCREVGEGSVNSAGISVRKVVELALSAGASTVVLAHNHPSGLALPSQEDIQTTSRLALALKAVDIHLADHFVFADEDYVSMALSGGKFRDALEL